MSGVNTATTFEAMLKAGFEYPATTIPRRLIANVNGLPKTGKTHFALTGKKPIVYFNLDNGDEGVIQQFLPDKEIIQYNVHIPEGEDKKVYDALWTDLRKKFDMALQMPQGTVVMDTASEGYELSRLAEFGKLAGVKPFNYADVYREWRKIIDDCYASKVSVVFIHTLKPRYVDDKRTSEYDVAGYNQMEYISQINIRTFRTIHPETKQSMFSARVIDCRHMTSWNGKELPVHPMMPESLGLGWLVDAIHGV